MTNLGWVVLTATVSAIIAGIALGWAELAVLGVVAGSALILAALQTIGRSTYSVAINLPSTRVKVGEQLNAEIVVQNSGDRKSTRLNSSHVAISYAVFCLKK